MKLLKHLSFALILLLPITSYAGLGEAFHFTNTDERDHQLSAPYDLRDRKSYIQITYSDPEGPPTAFIHVQIFQDDKNCDELDFIDELTQNDTVVYDLDNLVKNDGSSVPINLDDNSSGYIVLTTDSDGVISTPGRSGDFIVGNFRIVDDTGYEYRANMAGVGNCTNLPSNGNLTANFNTIDNANQADIIGYAYENVQNSTVLNIDEGFSFDIFVFDMNEEPLSCDTRNFACGNVMNYGVNEDYPNSKDGPLLCPGGGLADPSGGFISFENITNLDRSSPNRFLDTFVGFIGINNDNGTGSMDIWHLGTDFFSICF